MTDQETSKSTPFQNTFNAVMSFEAAMTDGRVDEAAAIEHKACTSSPKRQVWFEMSRQLLADAAISAA